MNTLKKIKYIAVLSKSLIGSYKSGFLLTILLGFVNGLAGSIGVGIVIPLFSLLTNSKLEEADFITRAVAGFFETIHVPLTPIFLIAAMVLLFALKALAQFTAKYKTEKLAARFEKDFRAELFNRTLAAGWPYLLQQKTGYLERILLFDVTQAAGIFNQISGGILVTTSFIAYAFVAFKISATITVLTVIFGVFIFLVFKPLFFRVRKVSEEIGLTFKLVAHHVGQNIIGSKMVKTTSAEDKVAEKGVDYFEQLRKARVKMNLYSYLAGGVLEPMAITFMGILFAFSYKTSGFSIATFGVVVYLIHKMFSFIQSGQGQLQGLSALVPYLESTSEYRDSSAMNKEESAGMDKFLFNQSLEFKNVKFSYGRSAEVLRNLSFSIQKGQMVGIVGPSGAGKTTIVDLFLRLLRPQSGRILLDGKDVSLVDLKGWRKNIGYVPQDIFLLNDTVENNIKFYDETIPEEKIVKAARMAGAYDFIQRFPAKFRTIVGERGLELSGGQRQRIVLARTLARNPQILILDEATSAVDAESEAIIHKSILGLKGKITTIVIAHRLSTVTASDHLLVLDEGKIVEQGEPKQLLKNKDSHFYKMYHIRK